MDLWYDFTLAQNGSVDITNAGFYDGFELFDACAGTQINCFTQNGSFTNLVSGINYKLRVFRTQANNQQSGTSFNITQTSISAVNTWSGATDNSWSTASNWSLGSVPINTDNVIIANVANNPIINSGTHVTVNDLTINTSGVLIVNGGGDITVNSNSTNNGMFIIGSGGSLIVKGISSGNITYRRNLASTNWHLVSSPIENESVQDVYDLASFATGTGANIGLAEYKNNGTAWNYFTATMGVVSPATTLASGKGYSVKLSAISDIEFTGDMPITNVNIAITDGAINKFNLIGNPYPSYIPANNNANAVHNILTINSAQLSEETLWFWDESINSYAQINQATTSRFIAPAQGFFVNSKTGGGTFSFTEVMQSHQTTDVFNRTASNRFEINLAITDGAITRHTEIFYIDGTTTAFDNGYDSSIFEGTSNEFTVYTQAIGNSQGRKLGIQSLPDSNYENMRIPIGVNAVSGTEITFSVDVQNIPAGLDVYLENREENTFTKLNNNGSYTLTLNADSNGVGQFYLRISSSALGLGDVTLESVNIYQLDKETLRIIGLEAKKTTLKIFSIQGRKILETTFKNSGSKDVVLPKISAGIYILSLETAKGKLKKKISIH